MNIDEVILQLLLVFCTLGLGVSKEISIEPGLFEWLGWYQSGIPKFLTPAEMKEAGFNVRESYQPIWPINKYNVDESTEMYYDRCHCVTKEILKKHESEGRLVAVIVLLL